MQAAVSALLPQVNFMAVIEAGPDRFSRQDYPDSVTILSEPTGSLNISQWWNIGIDWASNIAGEIGAEAWDVAIINDDVIVQPTWLCYIADDMRILGCVASCSGGTGTSPIIHRSPGPVSLYTRLQGFAFVLAGESGIRADERLEWWYQDDKLTADAASAGGMVMYPDCHVRHLFPNGQMTPQMHVQIAKDREMFVNLMGYAPW